MNHLCLFSGIGGFILAAQRTEFTTVQAVEIEAYCRAVLRKNFPTLDIHDDIRTFTATHLRGTIGLLTGGFPCQDISIAGKGAGIEGERSGLWRTMFRVICECRPSFVLIENVPALRNRGADRVLSDLEGAGYTAGAFVVGADDIGATHRRKRVWIVAYDAMRRGNEREPGDVAKAQQSGRGADTSSGDERDHVAYSNGSGRGEHRGEQSGREELPSSEYRGATVADTPGAEQQGDQCGVCAANSGREVDRHAQRQAGTDLARSGNEDVADPDELDGRRELRQPDLCEQRTRLELEGNGKSLPAFPPARNDFRGWAAVAEMDATLMPCVEREIRGVASRLPYRVDGIEIRGSLRNHRLKALGNAIVPQVAELFCHWIYNQLTQSKP